MIYNEIFSKKSLSTVRLGYTSNMLCNQTPWQYAVAYTLVSVFTVCNVRMSINKGAYYENKFLVWCLSSSWYHK